MDYLLKTDIASDLKKEQIARAFRDFKAKERASWHLREMPPTLEPDKQ